MTFTVRSAALDCLFIVAVQFGTVSVSGVIVTADERRECKSAVYYYGVVSTEMVCPPELVKRGEAKKSTKCKKCAIEELCGRYDGSSSSTYNCDPMVDIYRAADFHSTSIKKHGIKSNVSPYIKTRYPVQWLMEGQKDPAYYFRLRTSWLTQYVYKVNDSDLTPSEHCATLVARVRDRDGPTELLHTWGQKRFVEYEEIMPDWYTTKLPLPLENGVELGVPFIYSQLYNTNTKIKIKVNYLVHYDEVFITGSLRKEYARKRGPENVASEGMKVLKSDLNISPKAVKTGTHELVCYSSEEGKLLKATCPLNTILL